MKVGGSLWTYPIGEFHMTELELVENILIELEMGSDEEVSYLEYVVRSAMTAGYCDRFVWRKSVFSSTQMSFAAAVPAARPFVIELQVEWNGSDKSYRVIAVSQMVGGGDPDHLVEEVGSDHALYEVVEHLHLQVLHWFRRKEFLGTTAGTMLLPPPPPTSGPPAKKKRTKRNV